MRTKKKTFPRSWIFFDDIRRDIVLLSNGQSQAISVAVLAAAEPAKRVRRLQIIAATWMCQRRWKKHRKIAGCTGSKDINFFLLLISFSQFTRRAWNDKLAIGRVLSRSWVSIVDVLSLPARTRRIEFYNLRLCCSHTDSIMLRGTGLELMTAKSRTLKLHVVSDYRVVH